MDFFRVFSRFPNPPVFAASCIALAAVILGLLLRANRRWIASVLAAAVLLIGLSPIAAVRFIKARAIYKVHVEVLRPDQSLTDIALLKSSQRGELRMVPGGWELEVPAKERPADGKITFSASVKDEFLVGQSSLTLADNFYPTATVRLSAITAATLRGVVVDDEMRAVEGARVSVEGNPQSVLTDSRGNFVIPAHAGNGQIIEVSAKKGQTSGRLSAKAGKTVEIIVTSQ